jgi:GNAT superfamily N-acetyltransferase
VTERNLDPAERAERAPELPYSGPVSIRDSGPVDRAWIAELLQRRWGSTTVVSRGRTNRADLLPAIVAEKVDGQRGLATYRVEDDEVELVTLDAEPPGQGVGTALLAAVIEASRSQGCHRLWLVTTNDNLDALRFYQRRGLRLAAVHVGAVDRAREIKPTIPRVGANGIAIHDELELAVELSEAVPSSPALGTP